MDQESYSYESLYSLCNFDSNQNQDRILHLEIEPAQSTLNEIKRVKICQFEFVMSKFMQILNQKVRSKKEACFKNLKYQYGPNQYPLYSDIQDFFPFYQIQYAEETKPKKQDILVKLNWTTVKLLCNQLVRRLNYIKKMNMQAAFDQIQISSLNYIQSSEYIDIEADVQFSVSDSQNPSFYVQQIIQAQQECDNNLLIQFQQRLDEQLFQHKSQQQPFSPKTMPISLKRKHKKRKNKQKAQEKLNGNEDLPQEQDKQSFCFSLRDEQSNYYFDLEQILYTNYKQQQTLPAVQSIYKTEGFIMDDSDATNLSPISSLGRIDFTKNKKTESCLFWNQIQVPDRQQRHNSCNQNMIEQPLQEKDRQNKRSIFNMDDQLFFTN